MQVSDLRGILEYIPRFRERTFIIAIDGGIIESENFSNLLLDLAVLRSLNILVAPATRLRNGPGHSTSTFPTATVRASPTRKLCASAWKRPTGSRTRSWRD